MSWAISITSIHYQTPVMGNQSTEIYYRKNGTNDPFVLVGNYAFDTNGNPVNPPISISPIPDNWSEVQVKIVNLCDEHAFIKIFSK